MRRGWIAGALVVTGALVVLSTAFANAQGDDTPRGTDPLSADEVQAARDAALADEGASTESLGANGLPDRVVLMVERHEEAKTQDGAERRRADVYEYSYPDNTLTRSVIDLESGQVDDTNSSQGTQLPLVQVEADRAVEVLFADQAFADRLASEFEAASGRALGDPSADLQIEPITFRADSMPVVAQGNAAACGVDRCAQFLIQTTDHVLINLFPLVNLSRGELIATDSVFQG